MATASKPVPLVKIIHDQKDTAQGVDALVSWVDQTRIAARVVSGAQAFRSFDAIANKVGLNQAGNLRGMVVSERWKTIYNVVDKSEGAFSRMGLVASLAAGLIEAAPEVETTLGSSDSPLIKGLRLTTIAGTISERTLLGVVPFGTHLIYMSLEGWLRVAGLMGGSVGRASASGVGVLQGADALVQKTFMTWTDTQKQGEAVWTVVNLVTSGKK